MGAQAFPSVILCNLQSSFTHWIDIVQDRITHISIDIHIPRRQTQRIFAHPAAGFGVVFPRTVVLQLRQIVEFTTAETVTLVAGQRRHDDIAPSVVVGGTNGTRVVKDRAEAAEMVSYVPFYIAIRIAARLQTVKSCSENASVGYVTVAIQVHHGVEVLVGERLRASRVPAIKGEPLHIAVFVTFDAIAESVEFVCDRIGAVAGRGHLATVVVGVVPRCVAVGFAGGFAVVIVRIGPDRISRQAVTRGMRVARIRAIAERIEAIICSIVIGQFMAAIVAVITNITIDTHLRDTIVAIEDVRVYLSSLPKSMQYYCINNKYKETTCNCEY
jgi:hypothetical protein